MLEALSVVGIGHHHSWVGLEQRAGCRTEMGQKADCKIGKEQKADCRTEMEQKVDYKIG